MEDSFVFGVSEQSRRKGTVTRQVLRQLLGPDSHLELEVADPRQKQVKIVVRVDLGDCQTELARLIRDLN
jgi:hypothetical protein